MEEARSLLTAAVAVLSDEPGPDTVQVMGYLAASYSMSDRADNGDVTQEALELAQRLGADDALLANLFNSRGIALGVRGRRQEAIAHFREALRLARVSGEVMLELGPQATSGTPSCATTPTRAWSTPSAARTCPGSSGCGTSWASASSTLSCVCYAPGSGTAPPRSWSRA